MSLLSFWLEHIIQHLSFDSFHMDPYLGIALNSDDNIFSTRALSTRIVESRQMATLQIVHYGIWASKNAKIVSNG